MSRDTGQSGGEVARFIQVIARRKWIVIAVVLLTTGAAIAYSILRAPVYGASSKVLISNQNVPLSVAGAPDASAPVDPIRFAATEAQVVRLRAVIDAARLKSGIADETTEDIRDQVSVDVGQDSDLLTIDVRNGDARRAATLADAIANEYVAYRTQLYISKIESARRDILAQLTSLRESGQASGDYYNDLQSSAQQLATLATIGSSNYNVVEAAGEAEQVSPQPVRDAIIAALIGLVAGLAIALLVDRLDRRVRSVAEVEELLGAPLLARVDAAPRDAPGGRRMVAALDRPQGSAAESFRMLRANYEFTNAVANAGVVMVSSARPREGKSTVAANLAATLAAAGRRVVLVDLDIRRPTMHTFFGIAQVPGATQVAAGSADLKDVVSVVELPRASESMGGTNGARAEVEGSLLLVPAGVQPPNPGQFIASRGVVALIERLRAIAEVVIVDVPPILACGDAKSLAPAVDATLLVVRLADTTRPILQELRREIDATACTNLGFVVTGAEAPVGYGYYVKKDDAAAPGGVSSDKPSLPVSR